MLPRFLPPSPLLAGRISASVNLADGFDRMEPERSNSYGLQWTSSPRLLKISRTRPGEDVKTEVSNNLLFHF